MTRDGTIDPNADRCDDLPMRAAARLRPGTAAIALLLVVVGSGCVRDTSEGKHPAALTPMLAADLPAVERADYPIEVLVRVRGDYLEESTLALRDARAQQKAFADRVERLLFGLRPESQYTIRATFPDLGTIAISVGREAYEQILESPDAVSIGPNRLSEPLLSSSTNAIHAPDAWKAGNLGAASTVVVIDTGAQVGHPFLSGKIASSSCYSLVNDCLCGGFPGPTTPCRSNRGGAGNARPGQEVDWTDGHGTAVAGIIAGRDGSRAGVAPRARVIPIRVVGSASLLAYDSDIARALYEVLTWRMRAPQVVGRIAAVNISLGHLGTRHATVVTCRAADASGVIERLVSRLWSRGVPVFAGTGNEGDDGAIRFPACLPNVFAVGFTNDGKQVKWSSNSNGMVDFLAPGVAIESSVPDDAYGGNIGTSFATPHVSGAFAILRARHPSSSATSLIEALRQTGTLVTDDKNGITRPFIDVVAALDSLP